MTQIPSKKIFTVESTYYKELCYNLKLRRIRLNMLIRDDIDAFEFCIHCMIGSTNSTTPMVTNQLMFFIYLIKVEYRQKIELTFFTFTQFFTFTHHYFQPWYSWWYLVSTDMLLPLFHILLDPWHHRICRLWTPFQLANNHSPFCIPAVHHCRLCTNLLDKISRLVVFQRKIEIPRLEGSVFL